MRESQVEAMRRRALRRAVEIPCEVVSRYVDQPLLYWATDLTPQGMWLDTNFPMERGEELVVCFKPAVWWPGRELMFFSEVVRSAQGGSTGMGLRFLDIDVHEARALKAWLRFRPPPLPKRRPRSKKERLLPLPACYAVAC
jgi:hypothetical protein